MFIFAFKMSSCNCQSIVLFLKVFHNKMYSWKVTKEQADGQTNRLTDKLTPQIRAQHLIELQEQPTHIMIPIKYAVQC